MLSETTLSDYYISLAAFNHDEAKQRIETFLHKKKRECNPSLLKICDCLILLSDLEKGYYCLDFLSHRQKNFFFRKEKHLDGYRSIVNRMMALEIGQSEEHLNKESVSVVCSLRSRMTEMYLNMSLMNRNGLKSIGDIVVLVRPLKDYLTETLAKDNETVVNLISPLLRVIELEVDVLLQLGEAQNLMSNLFFLVPINLLYSVYEKHQRLLQISTSRTTSTSIFSRSTSSFSLLSWLLKFYVTSLSKYTLYFHSVLVRQMHLLLYNSEGLFDNVSLDLINRVSTFGKRTAATNLVLIFDAAKENVPFFEHGYVLPFSRGENLSQLESFPVIFSWPLGAEVSKPLTVSLVGMVLALIHSGDEADSVQHIVEPSNLSSYFVSRVDKLMYLAVVYDLRREKDRLLLSFLEEIRDSLTGRAILGDLVAATS